MMMEGGLLTLPRQKYNLSLSIFLSLLKKVLVSFLTSENFKQNYANMKFGGHFMLPLIRYSSSNRFQRDMEEGRGELKMNIPFF